MSIEAMVAGALKRQVMLRVDETRREQAAQEFDLVLDGIHGAMSFASAGDRIAAVEQVVSGHPTAAAVVFDVLTASMSAASEGARAYLLALGASYLRECRSRDGFFRNCWRFLNTATDSDIQQLVVWAKAVHAGLNGSSLDVIRVTGCSGAISRQLTLCYDWRAGTKRIRPMVYHNIVVEASQGTEDMLDELQRAGLLRGERRSGDFVFEMTQPAVHDFMRLLWLMAG